MTYKKKQVCSGVGAEGNNGAKSLPKQSLAGCAGVAGKSLAQGCAVKRPLMRSWQRKPVVDAEAQRAPQYFLNSYHPLCEFESGCVIAQQTKTPPFADNSIRREPDFQHRFPSISGLCRCDKLVGQAQERDFIAYVTVKSAGPRRLVAILQVLHKMPNHHDAADWYRRKGLGLPSNCIVPGNPALPITHALPANPSTTQKEWDALYRWRAKQYPSFLICRAVNGPELIDPPLVPEDVFGRQFPNTRSPKQLSKSEFAKLQQLLP